jgi:tRNA-dihydrouridine synthase
VKVKKESTKAREAFFLDFATVIRDKFPGLPLLVTGGFRTRKTMDSALASGALDLVGIARPAVLNPLAPTNTLLDKDNGNARVAVASIKIPWLLNKIGNYVIGAGYETVSPDALFLRIMVLTLDPRLGT